MSVALRPRTVRIGLLYSTTGTYRVLGADVCRGALLAIEEVNGAAAHGVRFEVHREDPGGDLERYRRGCERLIKEHGISQILGCITSSSRKEIIPQIEKYDAQLWYSIPYEGFEAADNVFYTGACPNQHILPLFRYLLPRHGREVYLIGSNYIWAWENHRLARSLVTVAGGKVLADRYLPMGHTEVGRFIEEIADTRPAFVFCNLVGESGHAFYRAFAAAGLRDPRRHAGVGPIVSCDLTEPDLLEIGYPAALGILNQSVYFQSLPTPANRAFVARFQRRYGAAQPVSAMGALTYASVHLLAAAIGRAGSDDAEKVRSATYEVSVDSPVGELKIDPDNNHAYLTPMLGRSVTGAHFETLVCGSDAVKPDPFLAWADGEAGALAVAGDTAGGETLRVVK